MYLDETVHQIIILIQFSVTVAAIKRFLPNVNPHMYFFQRKSINNNCIEKFSARVCLLVSIKSFNGSPDKVFHRCDSSCIYGDSHSQWRLCYHGCTSKASPQCESSCLYQDLILLQKLCHNGCIHKVSPLCELSCVFQVSFFIEKAVF